MSHPCHICNICQKIIFFPCDVQSNHQHQFWMIIWQIICGCFTHLPVKVATLLSASLHLLSFYSCYDLHNLSHRFQDLLVKYVCTDRCRYACTETLQQQCVTGSLYCCHKPNASADLRSLQLYRLRDRQPDRRSPFPILLCCCLQGCIIMLPLEHFYILYVCVCVWEVGGGGCLGTLQGVCPAQKMAAISAPLLISYFCKYSLTWNCAVFIFVYTWPQTPTIFRFTFFNLALIKT